MHPTSTTRPRGWLLRARAAADAALDAFASKPATRTETKSHAAVPLIRVDSMHYAAAAPRDYTAFAREGFMQNAIVYRCIRMIAENAANVPFLLYDGDHEQDDHSLLTLINAPNSTQTRPDFIEELIGFLLVSGNAYVEAVTTTGEDIRALYCLRPDRVSVLADLSGWPEGHVYTLNGRERRLTGDVIDGVRRVLHLKQFHPLNDHYGMSPIEAAAQAVDLHNTAAKWNKALLDNSARPSGALVYTARDGNLTSDQFERLKRELETGFQGSQNAGRPLLLEGGLDWKAMSLSPKDLDFLEAKHASAREIALALGVPPQLLGLPGDNTYANYAEANRAFWRQTVIPTVNRIATAFTNWLAKPTSPTLSFKPNYDDIDALAPEREALWSRLNAASFLTPNEKRTAANFDPHADGNELKRARLRLKYSTSQPRTPSGNGRQSGRWTKPSDGTSGTPSSSDSLDPDGGTGDLPAADLPEIDIDIPDIDFTRSDITWVDPPDPEPEPFRDTSHLDTEDGERDPNIEDVGRGSRRGPPPMGHNNPPGPTAGTVRTTSEPFNLGQNITIYRQIWNMGPDAGTVATAEIDGQQYMGVNSTGPGYTREEWEAAREMRDKLIANYKDEFTEPHHGRFPYNAMFHAEAHLLMRAARERGGTLEGVEFSLHVDRHLCQSCETVLPYLSRELGDPTIHIFGSNGSRRTIRNGYWDN